MTFLRATTCLLVAALSAACTPEIKQEMGATWQEVKTFPYAATLAEFSGVRDAFPSNAMKVQDVDNQMCLHDESDERVASINGVSDQYYYRHCMLMPYPTLKPQRF